MDYLTLSLIIQTTVAYSVKIKLSDINNTPTHEHFKYSHVRQMCESNSFKCNTNSTNVCAIRKWKNETVYEDFDNSCVLFLRNMCDYPGAEFYIVSGGSCADYLRSRRSDNATTVDEEYEYYSDNSTEFNGTTKSALREVKTTRFTYDVEEAYDGHPCPYHCTDDYKPICISANRNYGKYLKFMTFINHCQGDMYYCKHWKEFSPPPDESEEIVDDSPLGWSYCGASRYLRFARFSEVASSMGHYGWLKGDYRYSKILTKEQRAGLNRK